LLAEYPALLLTGAIVLGYAWALHLVVRGERRLVRTALFLVFVSALVLRFAAGREYPPGMNEDEPKVLACALNALKDKRLHREGCSGIPILLNALFQAQLVPILGPNRESMRFYPAVSGALSVIAVYGLARALQFTVFLRPW
jgi:dolichyl-phosphate-mannose--protein O-mannosyl transferase